MRNLIPLVWLLLLLSILYSCDSISNNKSHSFKEGKAIVKGMITNPVDSFIIFTYQGDPATGYHAGERYIAQLQPDGSFEVQILLKKPVELYSDYGGKNLTVYLQPNYTTSIAFDGKDFKGVLYSGDGQEENKLNREINNFNSQQSSRLNDSKAGLSFDEIKLLTESAAKQKLTLLEDAKSEKQLSDHFYKWKKAEITYEVPSKLYFESKQHKVDYLTAVELSSYDLNDDFAASYSKQYNSAIDFYTVENFLKVRKEKKYNHNYDHDKELLKDQTRDALLARTVLYLINHKFDSLAVLYHAKAQADIADPAILAQVNDVFSEYQQIKSKGYKVGKDALAKNAPALYSILSKYKGKVVYIDFWASWCGPCIRQLDYAKDLHDKYSAKDVVFLYLGYKDKEAAWQKVRKAKDIPGEHFLLTNEQIKEVELLLKIHGIPRYAIMDKAGNIVDDDAPDPNHQRLLPILNKLNAK